MGFYAESLLFAQLGQRFHNPHSPLPSPSIKQAEIARHDMRSQRIVTTMRLPLCCRCDANAMIDTFTVTKG